MIRFAPFILSGFLALIFPAAAQTSFNDPEQALDAEAAGDTDAADQDGPSYERYDTVQLRALDKITGRFTDFELTTDEPMVYGSLLISVEVCFQRPPEEVPESAAFLHIIAADSKQVQTMAVPRRLTPEEKLAAERVGSDEADLPEAAEASAEPEGEDADIPENYFSGWMYASSPGLSALEHPVYDVWVISCSAASPDTPVSGNE